jgi:hypothetical protein
MSVREATGIACCRIAAKDRRAWQIGNDFHDIAPLRSLIAAPGLPFAFQMLTVGLWLL